MAYVLGACALIFCLNAMGDDSPVVAKPLLTTPGDMILSDSLVLLPVDPQSRMGKWEIREGALIGSERAEDRHGAVLRRPKLKFHDAAVGVSFRLEGARGLGLGLISANGHVAAVRVTSTTIQLNRSLFGGDKSEVLDAASFELRPGSWHHLILESCGSEVVASIDGQQVVFGQHDSIDVDKTCIRLTVAGESVAFKDLHIHAATLSPGWQAMRAKLQKDRQASK